MKIDFTLRPAVTPTPRKAMTPARKRRIHGLADGICGCGCGWPVPMFGPGVIYDHEIMLEHGGLDDWPNLRPVLAEHDKPKTAEDLRRVGKGRRQEQKLNLAYAPPKSAAKIKSRSVWPKGRKLQNAGFPKGRKRPIPPRPFR